MKATFPLNNAARPSETRRDERIASLHLALRVAVWAVALGALGRVAYQGLLFIEQLARIAVRALCG